MSDATLLHKDALSRLEKVRLSDVTTIMVLRTIIGGRMSFPFLPARGVGSGASTPKALMSFTLCHQPCAICHRYTALLVQVLRFWDLWRGMWAISRSSTRTLCHASKGSTPLLVRRFTLDSRFYTINHGRDGECLIISRIEPLNSAP